MDPKAFERLVAEALDSLPPFFAARLANVEVVIEERPSPAELRALGMGPGDSLYGQYVGTPLTARNSFYGLTLPDRIVIYREPLVRAFRSPAALRRQVARTVIHELAHHFGLSDDRLDELGAY
jgi:predicted Zn-dependent protease with MMP-like domain